jgi:hypothetical protein
MIFIFLYIINIQASENIFSNLYVGIDSTINAKGSKSFGSGTDMLDKAFDYKIEKGIQYKIGYKFNDILKIEYGYSYFFSKEYKNFLIHSLTTVLSTKYVSTQYLFHTKYNVYPSYEIGFTNNVINLGANLHFEYDKNYSFLISYRTLTEGLGIGGENNNIAGYYLGLRYMF